MASGTDRDSDDDPQNRIRDRVRRRLSAWRRRVEFVISRKFGI